MITGAAAIMMAVFIAFAAAPIATVSQLGIGLTVAVLLDATVVRIVLLPALMLLLGDRVWWLPPCWTGSCPTSTSRGRTPTRTGHTAPWSLAPPAAATSRADRRYS